MFPDSFLEYLYWQNQNRVMFADTVPDGARIAEQWLLSFTEAEDPEGEATKSFDSISTQEAEKRFIFAISLVLSSPCRSTGQVFESYETFLKDNRLLIASWINEIARDMGADHGVDVLRGFDCLPDKHFYANTYGLYSVTADSLRIAAVARDNLKVLMSSLTEEELQTRKPLFDALSHFPIKKNSRAYRAIIKSPSDEQRLIRVRLERLYGQLSGQFTHGIRFLHANNKSGIALCADNRIYLKRPGQDEIQPFYKHPSFKAALESDPKSMIKAFFIHRDAQLSVNPLNWGHVDQITQAFLDAGISAEQIIEHGTRGRMATSTNLKSALTKFGLITEENQRFYQVAYKAYISEYDADEVIANCVDDKTLLAVYKATGNQAFLEAGSHLVRESAMASDLGL